MSQRKISRADYEKAIKHSISKLNEINENIKDLQKLEEKVIDVATRLKTQIHIAGLMSRGFKMVDIAQVLGVASQNISRYLDGKQTPKRKTWATLDATYHKNRKQKHVNK